MDFDKAYDHITVHPEVHDWWVSIWDGGYTLCIEEEAIPNADTDEWVVPGGVCVNLPYCPEDNIELAQNLVAAKMFEALHEGLEWIRVDGERLADPHPEDYASMEKEVFTQCLEVVRRYLSRHPLQRA
jgi:hypothetical protein